MYVPLLRAAHTRTPHASPADPLADYLAGLRPTRSVSDT